MAREQVTMEEVLSYHRKTNEHGFCNVDVSGEWLSIHEVRVKPMLSFALPEGAHFGRCVSPRRYPENIRVQGYADATLAEGIREGVMLFIEVRGIGRPCKDSLTMNTCER